MNILLVTDRFLPSVGGVQTVTRLLGQALVRAEHEVRVVTREQGNGSRVGTLRVERRLHALALLKQYSWADVVVLQGLTVRLGWPLCLIRRPALVVHHTMPSNPGVDPSRGVRERLARRVRHATVSEFMATQLTWPLEAVLPNPYDDQVFRPNAAVTRTRDIAFVGRLIPEKGAHVLIEALSMLRRTATKFTATIVGAGPERSRLDRLVATACLEDCVHFVGEVTDAALAKVLIQHRLLVVPSVYDEPFGIVALEGIACGCVVVASHTGGLPKAIGPCGITFPKGDSAALATKLNMLLPDDANPDQFRAHAQEHLSRHRPEAVARSYLRVLTESAGIMAEALRMKDEGKPEAETCSLS